jgi:hypothetical protein
MKIIAPILLALLSFLLIRSIFRISDISSYMASPLIPESIIASLRKSLLIHVIINIIFLSVSVYFTMKKKYLASIIVSCSFILASVYVINLFLND